jgi:hypothetical protein
MGELFRPELPNPPSYNPQSYITASTRGPRSKCEKISQVHLVVGEIIGVVHFVTAAAEAAAVAVVDDSVRGNAQRVVSPKKCKNDRFSSCLRSSRNSRQTIGLDG